ncbi:MAG: protein TolR [Thiobacillaceae bacterium]|jgi:biopolymer transport protein TolR|nr:protein TolR [Thiobacillaceae bacterium]
MSGRRPRKSIAQINVVPYIDVMLVLLIIFMVTAPFISPGQVELPSVGKSSTPPVAPLEVMLRADGELLLRDRGASGDEQTVSADRLIDAVRARLRERPDQPVVISADKDVRYEAVMRVMDALQQAGAPRVGLLVKPATP